MSEAVRVVVRARPFNKQEIADKRVNIVAIDSASGTVTIKNPRATVRGSVKAAAPPLPSPPPPADSTWYVVALNSTGNVTSASADGSTLQ